MLGLRFCARAFSSCGERGPLFITVRGPLTITASLLLRSTGSRRAGSVVVAHGPSCSAACGILPDQGSNPCPPALAGRFSTTAPPGKPWRRIFLNARSCFEIFLSCDIMIGNILDGNCFIRLSPRVKMWNRFLNWHIAWGRNRGFSSYSNSLYKITYFFSMCIITKIS